MVFRLVGIMVSVLMLLFLTDCLSGGRGGGGGGYSYEDSGTASTCTPSCSTGQACSGGRCVNTTCTPHCSATCGVSDGCTGTCVCPTGYTCSSGTCTASSSGVPSSIRTQWFYVASQTVVGVYDFNGMVVGSVLGGSAVTWQYYSSIGWQRGTPYPFTYTYDTTSRTLRWTTALGNPQSWQILSTSGPNMRVRDGAGSVIDVVNCDGARAANFPSVLTLSSCH